MPKLERGVRLTSDRDFKKKKKFKNLSQMISPVQKQGFLNVTEPAPVDGTNEASTNGYENNASSTNNANQ
jgi:hypothetical protein